jgi:hypothetical protein
LRVHVRFALLRIVLGYGDAPTTDFAAYCSVGANAAAKRVYRSVNTIQTGGINLAQAPGS